VKVGVLVAVGLSKGNRVKVALGSGVSVGKLVGVDSLGVGSNSWPGVTLEGFAQPARKIIRTKTMI
jgi:hypothetical protein